METLRKIKTNLLENLNLFKKRKDKEATAKIKAALKDLDDIQDRI